jgi:hypothetical protein
VNRYSLIAVLCVTASLQGSEPSHSISRTTSFSCERAWGGVVQALALNGFSLTLADRAGGVAQAQSSRPPSRGGGAVKDMQGLTANPLSRFSAVDEFRIGPATITLAESTPGCQMIMSVSYSVLRNNLIDRGWVSLESNGRLETMVLAEAERLAPPAPPVASGNRPPEGPYPAAGPDPVLRISSEPSGAEINIDGKYAGSTPVGMLKQPVGPHVITLTKRGFVLWKRTIDLAAGDDRRIDAELDVEPPDPTKPRIIGLP